MSGEPLPPSRSLVSRLQDWSPFLVVLIAFLPVTIGIGRGSDMWGASHVLPATTMVCIAAAAFALWFHRYLIALVGYLTSQAVDASPMRAIIVIFAILSVLRVQSFWGDWIVYGPVAIVKPSFFFEKTDFFWRGPLGGLFHAGSVTLFIDWMSLPTGVAARLPLLLAGAVWLWLCNRLCIEIVGAEGWFGSAIIATSGAALLAFGHFEIYIYQMLALTAVAVMGVIDWRGNRLGGRSAFLMGTALIVHPMSVVFLPLFWLLVVEVFRRQGTKRGLQAVAVQALAGAIPIAVLVLSAYANAISLPSVGTGTFEGTSPWLPAEMAFTGHRLKELTNLTMRAVPFALPVFVLALSNAIHRRDPIRLYAIISGPMVCGVYLLFAWNAMPMDADWDMFVPVAVVAYLTMILMIAHDAPTWIKRCLLIVIACQIPLLVAQLAQRLVPDPEQSALMEHFQIRR